MTDSETKRDEMGLPAFKIHTDDRCTPYAPAFEKILVQKFGTLLMNEPARIGCRFAVKHEVGVGKSIADIVTFLLPQDDPIYDMKFSVAEAVIVSLVRVGRAVPLDELSRITGMPTETVRKKISRLKQNLVLIEEREWITFSNHAPKIKITAYEAKLRDWRGALTQATEYFAFADEAYVVMPEASIGNVIKGAEQFRKSGVGLLCVSERNIQTIFPSKLSDTQDWRREFVYSRSLCGDE